MNIKKLSIARNKIDKIDNAIFLLIKKRNKVVNHVLTLKNFKNQIGDYKRINKILRNIKTKSIRNNIDPKITLKIWKAMIWGFIAFEKKKFKKK